MAWRKEGGANLVKLGDSLVGVSVGLGADLVKKEGHFCCYAI